MCVYVLHCVSVRKSSQHNSHHLPFFLLIIKQLKTAAAVPTRHKQVRISGTPTPRATLILPVLW